MCPKNFIKERALIVCILLILAAPALALTVNVRCHREQIITKDKGGLSHVENTGENICESTPNDWKE